MSNTHPKALEIVSQEVRKIRRLAQRLARMTEESGLDGEWDDNISDNLVCWRSDSRDSDRQAVLYLHLPEFNWEKGRHGIRLRAKPPALYVKFMDLGFQRSEDGKTWDLEEVDGYEEDYENHPFLVHFPDLRKAVERYFAHRSKEPIIRLGNRQFHDLFRAWLDWQESFDWHAWEARQA